MQLDDDRQMAQNLNLQRDITVVRNRIQAKKLPIVWMNSDGDKVGNTMSSHSHACNIAERFGYACISLDKVFKEESEKETRRGKLVKNKINKKKRIPDRLVLDLIKEKIIQAGDTRGYLINGFPLNGKQSTLFVKEIAKVDCIIVLESTQIPCTTVKTNNLNSIHSDNGNKGASEKISVAKTTGSKNAIRKEDSELNVDKPSGDKKANESMRTDDLYKDLYSSRSMKYDLLVEKINTNEPPADVFLKIEAAILDRLSINNL